ncbi:hypothetical protein [Corynebacterium liangguodongii]|uniref:Uncharacterized protein n=1 Tax=Corynebacterium liangguodongii TaxID=2079535 RepID=A0A2S0WBP9_9CORY|nr:hypothetical protein [Corynebacterium liangguodongii]AWB83187.1 hypothetical protein C3E79_00740 [Corynebacterium liangguodongii]PWB98782.1 hypothetical protein DF219_10200 [Corynebacterium liangguodongii]
MRKLYRLSGLKARTESHSPEEIVGKVKHNLANDKDAPYSDVFFDVDVDESSFGQLEQGISHAERVDCET